MHLTPSLAQMSSYSGPEAFVAVSATTPAKGLTPLTALAKLGGQRCGSFLLESSAGEEEIARYSFLAAGVPRRIIIRDGQATIIAPQGEQTVSFSDPLELLREELSQWTVWAPEPLPRFFGGAVGYLGFDCVRYFEPVPLPSRPGLGLPEAFFLLTDEVCIFDHVRDTIVLVVLAPLRGDRVAAYEHAAARLADLVERLDEPGGASPSRSSHTSQPPARSPIAARQHGSAERVHANRSRQDLERAVSAARDAIVAGEVFQVVLSQRLSIATDADPMQVYQALGELNPSPYMFYLQLDGFAVVGASPEVLVRLDGGDLLVRPIAGTRPRGRTPQEDQALEVELRGDEKELAEHRMLVDLGRNDLGRVSTIGSVRVERPIHVERYSHVMHLVTDVRARLAEGLDAFDVLRACFPAGTVSGAPKIRACQLIAELEPDRRGVYAGAVGFFCVDGSIDTCIAIRTLVATREGIHVQAGAGVVFDSVPEREYHECLHKAEACLAAIRRLDDQQPHVPHESPPPPTRKCDAATS